MGKDKFIVSKITKFKDLVDNKDACLPESDLCLQDNDCIVQFKFKAKKKSKLQIKPGIYTFTSVRGSIKSVPTELRKQELLETIVNTSAIIGEANIFFSKLHVYDQLNLPKKRGVLLYSAPGLGKSAAISKFCEDSIKEEPGTVVFIWPTSSIDADMVTDYLGKTIEYAKECKRLVLLIEDIGGVSHEGHEGPRKVDAAMLNLLDGVENCFRLPTFIIATTNYPENLLSALADRPQRFDKLIELLPPSRDEKIALTEFFAKRPLTEDEKKIFDKEIIKDFSIAHLQELVVRSMLHDKTLMQIADELIAHKKRFKASFGKDSKMGFDKDEF